MSQRNYILAHDLGTTGNKATLFDAAGTTVASTFYAYQTDYPRPNWAEQDPADWQRAVFECTRRLLAESSVPPAAVAAVSFSGHMQGAVVVDGQGLPLRPAIIWADQRAAPQADLVRRTCGEEDVYRLTGHRISPAYTLSKVLWIKDNQPDVYRHVHKVLQPKDYAAFLLTGVLATDYSDASGTQAFDLQGRRWAGDALHALGLAPDLFPDVYPSTAVIGTVTGDAAAATGLLPGTPVVVGGGDGACATVGAGAVQGRDTYTYVGSSAWIAFTTSRPVFDPQRRTFNFAHLDPGLYFAIGTMQAAGGAYAWLERLLRGEEDQPALYGALDAQAASVPAGAGGLLFLPYLLGERSPHWNPLARGAFVGLAMSHGRAEVSRAVLEGVAFNLRMILDALRGQGVSVAAMRLIGGAAQSPLWRQILADVYDLPILLPTLTTEATALGAAIAGGVGVGLFPDFSVAARFIPVQQAERPEPGNRPRYAALYDLFQHTYQALEPIYEQLAPLAE
jgi:xylulokinase